MAQDLFIENTSHFRSLDLELHTETWFMTHIATSPFLA